MSITKTVRQELRQPVTSKAIDGTVIGVPVAVILVWVFEVATSIDIPTGVATSFGGLVSIGISLLIPERRRKF